VLRRFAIAWIVAALGFALLGAILAGIAIARAQYPMLGSAERLALAAAWTATAALAGAVAGIALGCIAALAPARWSPLRVAIAGTLLGAALLYATRGDEPTAESIALRAVPPIATSGAALARERPNLVLITIDTLRADHLDLYGYARETAPNLRDFAAGGAVFETAIAQAPATQLSMASMLTGLWPWSHEDATSPRPKGSPFLRSGFATLAERLAAGGWETGGFIANIALREREGYAQGFQRWDQSAAAIGSGGIEHVLDPALAWLATVREPFFLWVHAIDPHHPYHFADPAPWEDASTPDFARFRDAWAARTVWEQTMRLDAVLDGVALDPAEHAYLVGRYDAEIRHADAGLARLFAALRARGATDANTLIVVTADHGEEFLDHGGMLHSRSLYDELLHVPLVVRGPGVPAGVRVIEQVRGVDVAATLLALAQLPADDLDGRSLAPFWSSEANEASRPALSSREGKYLSYRSDGEKLVVAQPRYPATEPPARGVAGLQWMARVAFDRREQAKVGIWPLGAEPNEERRAARAPVAMQRAYSALDELRQREGPRAVPFDAAAPIDHDAIEKLRALGYAQ
jgi:arylsulfatase